MSAEQYGARLLEEVQEESLDQFLARIRRINCPQPRAVLGISQLDELLEQLRYPTPTQQRRQAWPSPTRINPLDRRGETADEDGDNDSPNAGMTMQHEDASLARTAATAPSQKGGRYATIELTSRKSAVGKTTLLYYLSATFTLPRHLGGKESTVVYIDNDGRFSATRLAQIMQQHIHRSTQGAQPDEAGAGAGARSNTNALSSVIHEALNHIHVFRPSSSSQLLAILESLPNYLLDRTRHASAHRNLGLVVLDSATAFYWQDRFDREMARLDSSVVGGGGNASSTAATTTTNTNIINALKKLQTRFECVVALSTTTTSPSPSSTGTAPNPQHDHHSPAQGHTHAHTPPNMPSPSTPWTAYATLSLSLSRSTVPPFAPRASLDECLRDRDARFAAVKRARVVCTVVSLSSSVGSGVQPSFTIGEAGLEFE